MSVRQNNAIWKFDKAKSRMESRKSIIHSAQTSSLPKWHQNRMVWTYLSSTFNYCPTTKTSQRREKGEGQCTFDGPGTLPLFLSASALLPCRSGLKHVIQGVLVIVHFLDELDNKKKIKKKQRVCVDTWLIITGSVFSPSKKKTKKKKERTPAQFFPFPCLPWWKNWVAGK